MSRITSSKMVDYKQLIILLLVFFNPIACDFKQSLRDQVERLNNRTQQMYGRISTVIFKKNFDVKRIMYPRNDKRKLLALSFLWREYYKCVANMLGTLTLARQLPSTLMSVYQGGSARMTCNLCAAPGETSALVWMYSPSLDYIGSYTPLGENERTMIFERELTIFNVMPEDSGVYVCVIASSTGGLKILEVVDTEEKYIVVKPPTSQGPQAIPPEVYLGAIIYSVWSPWSDCSVCDKVGRRRRYGMCYVKLDPANVSVFLNQTPATKGVENNIRVNQSLVELFDAFPEGIPCNSPYLPTEIKELSDVQRRTNEIMIGMCRDPCPVLIIGDKTANETLVQWGTNAIEMFSLRQILPKQPPLPARNTIFAEFGEPLLIRCPGTTLRDVPLEWRIGTKNIVPRDIDVGSGGRVHLNARDQLVFLYVLYKDANVYSCWQLDNLAGTVKLIIWEGAHARWNHRVTLVTVVFTLILVGMVLHVINKALRNIRQRQSVLYYLN